MSAPFPVPSKAMLLAAGPGTRLRPLTEAIPKCMVEVGGRPVLEHTVRLLVKHGVRELVINLHHRPEVIREHFGDGERFGARITYSEEPEILGTAGAVRAAAALFDGSFLVWYGDNLCACRVDRLWARHLAAGGVATLAVHYRKDPTPSGIVALGANDRVLRFLEKPSQDQVFSRWVSAGIMVFEPRALDAIAPVGQPDFGRDVLPSLLEAGEMLYAYRLSQAEPLVWIDTPEDLSHARAMWKRA